MCVHVVNWGFFSSWSTRYWSTVVLDLIVVFWSATVTRYTRYSSRKASTCHVHGICAKAHGHVHVVGMKHCLTPNPKAM